MKQYGKKAIFGKKVVISTFRCALDARLLFVFFLLLFVLVFILGKDLLQKGFLFLFWTVYRSDADFTVNGWLNGLDKRILQNMTQCIPDVCLGII